MKGQISIDYIIAIVVFVVFAIFFLFQMINVVPGFLNLTEEQRMRVEAYQMTEVLINSPGDPEDWEISGGAKRLGLAYAATDRNNVIDINKVNAIPGLCDTEEAYESNIIPLMGLSESDLKLTINVTSISFTDGSRTTHVYCRPEPSRSDGGVNKEFVVEETRPVMIMGIGTVPEMGEVKVRVWKR